MPRPVAAARCFILRKWIFNQIMELSRSKELVCIKRAELDFEGFAHIMQATVESISQIIGCGIILRIEPPALQMPPQRFGNVQMRGIRGQKKQMQTPLLPYRPPFPYHPCPVHTRIIQDRHGRQLNVEGKQIQLPGDKFSVDLLACACPLVLAQWQTLSRLTRPKTLRRNLFSTSVQTCSPLNCHP